MSTVEMDPAAIDRIPCIAPGCRRGIGIDAWRRRFGYLASGDAQYVCQRHWSQVPSAMRRVYARAKRRERRFGTHLPSTHRLWRRLARLVTESCAEHP